MERREWYWANASGVYIPFALSALGLAIIWLGVLWQRREAEWSARLRGCLPAELRELIEARKV